MIYRLNRLLVTPAFFGAGMLSGLNASWSFRKYSIIDQCETYKVRTVAGSILAWGISEFFWHVNRHYMVLIFIPSCTVARQEWAGHRHTHQY